MTPSPDIARHYARMQIQTAATPGAICMLHNRCVQLIQQALPADAENEGREKLNRAQNILAELERSLQITDDVSQGLFYLYDHCYSLLETASDADRNSAILIMTTLRDTFNQLHRPPMPQHA